VLATVQMAAFLCLITLFLTQISLADNFRQTNPHSGRPLGFCGEQGEACCRPYMGSGGVIGPPHCNAGLGCKMDTHICQQPCGKSGEVCCDGPDTVASGSGAFYKDSSGNFVQKRQMCDTSSRCDINTNICNSDCGQSVGSGCCAPQPSLGFPSCINPSLICNEQQVDKGHVYGTCQTCGHLGERACPGTTSCLANLATDNNDICQACGALGQISCDGNCNDGLRMSEIAGALCEPKCGQTGEPCCTKGHKCPNGGDLACVNKRLIALSQVALYVVCGPD
jgi:hypothetical protein